MAIYEPRIGIKQWAEADRPREKLMLHGRRHLSDAELVAILIVSGNAEESAVDLSKRILASCNQDLDALGRLSVQDLCKFRGIGEARAISIIGALELGRRRKPGSTELTKITSSQDCHQELSPVMTDLIQEEFWILLLNRANQVIAKHQVSKGGLTGTVADPKVIFKIALEHNAAYVVLAHNHPSGNLKPSEEDLQLTRKLVSAGKLLDLYILDHLIITNKSFFSFNDEGLI
ncbi:RadC family protein [Pedobacter gandavensis]|uniref:DNA repair protein RadC n=1 Tax=Pedobacter gandavensis TaxID=2679963 RepID=A0ABR6EW15_9SPHI|nr:DNA repair protein RadC [Pedobacter gandavensis]MBB2149439.1 DNA repair protein RadC [Pedobacter gandavensis]